MKILVTGTGRFRNKKRLFQVLDNIHAGKLVEKVIAPSILGAATMASAWARINKVPCEFMEKRPKLKGRAAIVDRNYRMLEENPDVVLVADHNIFVDHLIDAAKRRKLQIIELEFVG